MMNKLICILSFNVTYLVCSLVVTKFYDETELTTQT